MHRLQADGTIVGRFHRVGPVAVSITGNPGPSAPNLIRATVWRPQVSQAVRPAEYGWVCRTLSNGLQHCSMPPFGCGLQVLVLKLPGSKR
ncbi:hypothetical protein NPIL_236531 [Nephila pilipes]|uniref:Uncharacterized protein n=1 Tax=Nephila pilipes TaxID=299642 RepID=A0A8X6N7C7_NEPPI|nr:hypothetical protein NPIL_236531 [Nephila pilipes]